MSALKWILGGAFLLAAAAGLGVVTAEWLLGDGHSAPDPVQETAARPPALDAAPRRVAAGADESPPAQRAAETVDSGARWAEVNRSAIDALEAGEYERAVELFEECLEADPAEVVFQRNLAEALTRMALRDHELHTPCEHCIALIERALALSPTRDDLGRLLDRWRRAAEAEEGFWRDSSIHFDLAYDGFREGMRDSNELLHLMEEIYVDLAQAFGEHPVEVGGNRIAVVLYERESFDRVTGLGHWAGGAFDGTVRVPVQDLEAESERLDRVLRHELVHAFVRRLGGPHVPGWLNEGIAQWHEPQRELSVSRARERLLGRELYTLERMQGSIASWTDTEEIARAYAQALLFTDYIARNYGERAVYEMVFGCDEGIDPAETFESWTRVELAAVLGDLQAEL